METPFPHSRVRNGRGLGSFVLCFFSIEIPTDQDGHERQDKRMSEERTNSFGKFRIRHCCHCLLGKV